MANVILYIDVSDVREGALEELKRAMGRLVDFVEANEPRLIAYNVYFSDDGARMTVVSVHPDSASLEHHMEVAGPLFRQFVELVDLSSIHIYGEPSTNVVELAREKARLLGNSTVVVEPARMQVSPVLRNPPRRTRVPGGSDYRQGVTPRTTRGHPMAKRYWCPVANRRLERGQQGDLVSVSTTPCRRARSERG
jgi:hypothetical protein